MEKMCFDSSVSVVSYIKNNNKFAMTCAWGMQVDYDKIMMLLGSQSDTGNNLKKGDIIGVSVLNDKQIDIALALGDKHSKSVDKLNGLDYKIKDNAILINNASREMIVEVIDVLHLEGIEVDNLLYGKVLDNKNNNDSFLTYQGFKDGTK